MIADDYSGMTKRFSYTPFTATPGYCGLRVSCINVSPANTLPCQELQAPNGSYQDATWTFTRDDYINKRVAPGDYTFTYEVCDELDDLNCLTFDVVVKVVDPCNSPEVQTPNKTNIEYIYGDPAASKTLVPQFTVSPDFCDKGRTQEDPANCGAYCEPIVYCDNTDPNCNEQKVNVGPDPTLPFPDGTPPGGPYPPIPA